jgi:hypothetical protein
MSAMISAMATRPATWEDHRERMARALAQVERLRNPGDVAPEDRETIIALRVR